MGAQGYTGVSFRLEMQMSGHRFFRPSALGLAAALAAAALVPGLGESVHAQATDWPENTYYVYVGAESADLMHRIRLGPDGASVERTTPVGEIAVETEGPHGFNISPDGAFLYMTTGHGVPDGKLWKFDTETDELAADPILLGYFPATLDLTPDGLFAFITNFNLHGEHIPSTISVVYTPDMMEVEQIEACVMPHGGRIAPDGIHYYTNCMMDDVLVEIDTRTFEVTRTFNVQVDQEGPIDYADVIGRHNHGDMDHTGGMSGMDHSSMRMEPTCSPTWAQPTPDGESIYVACNRGDRVHEIDRESWSLVRTIPTGRGAYNLAITPDGKTLIATLKQGGMVEFFDLDSGESVATLESTTTVTHGVVVSPDSRYAFVSVEGVGAEPGKVDIYDLTTFEEVASLEVGQQAGGIVFWKMEGPM